MKNSRKWRESLKLSKQKTSKVIEGVRLAAKEVLDMRQTEGILHM